MNQGKLDMIKQEMVTAHIDILGISELKWRGMGEFNSDGHYIYGFPSDSVGKESASMQETWVLSLGQPLYLLLWARIP